MIKFTPIMSLQCCSNTQSFSHDKSSSNSQLMKHKSRDLQKLLRHLSRIVTSAFKDGTGGCGSRSLHSGGTGGPKSRTGAFPIIFVKNYPLNHYQ